MPQQQADYLDKLRFYHLAVESKNKLATICCRTGPKVLFKLFLNSFYLICQYAGHLLHASTSCISQRGMSHHPQSSISRWPPCVHIFKGSWQVCMEYGGCWVWFSEGRETPLSPPLQWWMEQCASISPDSWCVFFSFFFILFSNHLLTRVWFRKQMLLSKHFHQIPTFSITCSGSPSQCLDELFKNPQV